MLEKSGVVEEKRGGKPFPQMISEQGGTVIQYRSTK